MVEITDQVPCVLVCQHRTCRKQGATEVLAAFQRLAPTRWTVIASQCLGQCGNGPMVRILPDNIWYWRVNPQEVAAIVERHLLGGVPVVAMTYPRFHPKHRLHP